MAVGIRAATYHLASVSNPTCTKPSGLSVGDLLIFFIHVDFGGTAPTVSSVPSGFNQLGIWDVGNFWAAAWSKVADSADVAATSFTVELSGAYTLSAVLAAFSDPYASNPIRDSGTFEVTTATTALSGDPNVDTEQNDLLVAFWGTGVNHALSDYAVAAANPTSWTETVDQGTTSRRVALASGVASSSADTGNWSATAAGNTTAFLFALSLANSAAAAAADLFLDGLWG